MKPVLFQAKASEEYLDALEYYSDIQPELGQFFDLEIRRLINEVGKAPERFPIFEGRVQRALSLRFPYSILYINYTDRIWIVAVMHAKRRPGCWKDRIL